MGYCSSECQQKDWGTHKDACAPREKSKAPLNPVQKECQAYMIAAQRCQRSGDRTGEGGAYGGLGNAFFKLGQYDKATEFHTNASACKVTSYKSNRQPRIGSSQSTPSLDAHWKALITWSLISLRNCTPVVTSTTVLGPVVSGPKHQILRAWLTSQPKLSAR